MSELDSKTRQCLYDIANRLRINSIKATNASKSGHPTSCTSIAEIMSVLFFHTMRYYVKNPRDPSGDRFVLSKGHAAPILYAVWSEAGLIPEEELLNLRKIDSNLEGHPTTKLSFVDVSTGSLGQGLSCAAGMAYTGKYFDKADYRIYCLIGDGESAEGAIWEALAFASYYKLDNLVAIVDINRLGQNIANPLEYNLEAYKTRMTGFGWYTCIVDGHNLDELVKAFNEATTIKDKPTCVLAKTAKGKGILGIEDKVEWHGKAIGDQAKTSIEHLEALIHSNTKLSPKCPEMTVDPVDISNIQLPSLPDYKIGDKVTTRAAFGNALAKLGHANSCVIALDGDTKDSTFSITFEDAHPERFIECFIAEQNLVGVAIGCTTRDRTVAFVSAFATFFSRAYDQIRMGAISLTNVNFVGSHCGVSIGEDGACEMGLEDIAMFRALPDSTVFYPSDAVSCEKAVELAANTKGICFIRTSRPSFTTIYKSDEIFQIGKGQVVHTSEQDQVTVIGAGITLHEALHAAKILEGRSGTHIRIIDPFTIKPLDTALIIKCAKDTGGRIITVEDHYPEGGLGEAVCSAVSREPGMTVTMLAVTGLPRSGKPEELLDMFGISSKCIVKAVEELLK